MKEIPINLINNLSPILQSSAFAKARIDYFIGQGKIWNYPAIMVIINEANTNKYSD